MQVIFSLILLLSLGFMFYYWQRSLTKRRITAFTALNGVLGLIATNDLKAALATFAVLSAIFSALNIRRNKRWRNLAVILAVVSTVILLVVSASPAPQKLPGDAGQTSYSQAQRSASSESGSQASSASQSGDDKLHYPELPAQTEEGSEDLPGKDRTAPPAPMIRSPKQGVWCPRFRLTKPMWPSTATSLTSATQTSPPPRPMRTMDSWMLTVE
ncbi:hypothetical protein [Aerococcus sanguinicola]|uniref:Uncharacterized protein n=1 Tax=Aerococcus sanguinicola TaxID=119206 RepID=A0A0X8FB52_9LACT|nr:hypothetical protein [Aerococcus sanguinicola]AMB94094.1 hypothetical protein AWM72_04645 [Aerococcus sanguinicola]